MKPKALLSLIVLLLFLGFSAQGQVSCDTSGNIFVFSNYDGGVLNLNVDVNRPNIKIGICSYEPVTVNLSGPYLGNVTEVRYAGYVSTNNFHCNNSASTTTINGIATNLYTINFLPSATLSNPNGYSSIVCAYSCNTSSGQGGCNTADQIKAYFASSMNGNILTYTTQYGCWSATPYNLSAGGNCCSALVSCNVSANAGPDTSICAGTSLQLAGSGSGGAQYSWSPATGLSNPNIANPVASPNSTTTYVLTVSDGAFCSASDTLVLQVNTVSVSAPTLPDLCENEAAYSLPQGTPSGGNWSGTGVSNGQFLPLQSGAGTYSLTYTYTDAQGCQGSAASSIAVLPAPTASLSNLPDLCLMDSAWQVSGGTPAGGVYAGPGFNSGFIFPSLAGQGSHTLSYTYTAANGCADTAYQSFSVNPNPATPGISQIGLDSLLASVPGDSFHWYLNGQLLPEQDQQIQGPQSGSYTVVVWLNGCPSTLSNPFVLDLVGIEEGLLNRLSLYPNPGTGLLHLRGKGQYALQIFDLRGKLLLEKSFSDGIDLDLDDWKSGVYLLRIRQGDQIAYRKWILQ